MAEDRNSLEAKIAALHDEIDTFIARRVDAVAAETPGVSRSVIERAMISRANGCRCAAARILKID
jgi:hypothetical protein